MFDFICSLDYLYMKILQEYFHLLGNYFHFYLLKKGLIYLFLRVYQFKYYHLIRMIFLDFKFKLYLIFVNLFKLVSILRLYFLNFLLGINFLILIFDFLFIFLYFKQLNQIFI